MNPGYDNDNENDNNNEITVLIDLFTEITLWYKK